MRMLCTQHTPPGLNMICDIHMLYTHAKQVVLCKHLASGSTGSRTVDPRLCGSTKVSEAGGRWLEGGCTGGRNSCWAPWRKSCHARPFLVGQASGLFKGILSTASAGAVCVITCYRAGCTCRRGGQCPRGACVPSQALIRARGAASHGCMRRGTVPPREWARGAAAPRAGGRHAPIYVKSKPDTWPPLARLPTSCGWPRSSGQPGANMALKGATGVTAEWAEPAV